jgi:hypothetical protein
MFVLRTASRVSDLKAPSRLFLPTLNATRFRSIALVCATVSIIFSCCGKEDSGAVPRVHVPRTRCQVCQ